MQPRGHFHSFKDMIREWIRRERGESNHHEHRRIPANGFEDREHHRAPFAPTPRGRKHIVLRCEFYYTDVAGFVKQAPEG